MGDDTKPEKPTAAAPGHLWPWLIVAALFYFLGGLVPLPGVEHEALTQLGRQSGLLGLFEGASQFAAVIGPSTGALLLVQLVLIALGRLDRPPFRIGGAVIYLSISFIQGVALATFLETMNSTSFFGDVVAEPGWKFRLETALTLTAGAAVLWWVFERIDRSRRAYGALFLAFLVGAEGAAGSLASAGPQIALGMVTPLSALIFFVAPFAWLVIAAVLILRPVEWPVVLYRDVELRSGWDVLGLAALGGVPLFAGGSTLAQLAQDVPIRGAAVMLGVVPSVAVAAAVVVMRFKNPAKPTAAREWGPGVVTAAVLGACLLLFATGLVTSGTLETALTPGPLEGDASFTLTLAPRGRFATGDGDAMIRRLDALGARARLARSTPDEIELVVEAASDVQSVIDALTPRSLELRFARELDEDPYLDRPGLSPLRSGDYDHLHRVRGWQGPCPLIEELAAAPSPTADDLAIERATAFGDEGRCTLHLLEPAVVLTGRDVADATVGTDSYSNAPIVMLTLTDRAAEAFESATATHIHRALAIVVDGEVLSAPIVQSAIPGGHLQITLGSTADPLEMLAQANNLVAALMPGGQISTSFTVVAEN